MENCTDSVSYSGNSPSDNCGEGITRLPQLSISINRPFCCFFYVEGLVFSGVADPLGGCCGIFFGCSGEGAGE